MLPPERIVHEVRGSSGTHSALLAPSAALRSCVRAYVTRSTVGARLSPQERCNHFPPTPTCVITWVLSGQLYRGGVDDASSPASDPVYFCGPLTQATHSHARGPVQTLSLFLYPDAVQAITALDVGAHVDRLSALGDVLPQAWRDMALAVLDAPATATRMDIIEAFLTPLWQAAKPPATTTPTQFQDWTRGVCSRASAQSGGQSERQIERRIKSWTGQPLRSLRGIGRAEDSLFRAREALQHNALRWIDIAADAGYADQAHLSREFARITGVRPSELRSLLEQESYWMYRVWTRHQEPGPWPPGPGPEP